ncbi:MAG: T9SS type A sorting domain-containing protein [Ignavibacteria bacterium]|nr:T9SS type A sorting domain-containing protein [Ignavibacteria bacterium]
MSIGLPDAASFQIPKIFYKYGNTLYFGTVGFLDSKPLFYYSNDGGLNWSSLTTNGLTTISGTTSSTSFAVTQQNIFLYDYNNTTKEASLYRLTNNTTSINNRSEIPAAFELAQNYPNPFNPETTISYELPTSTNVTLKIYDVLGNEVATLVNEFKNAGYHNVRFKSKDYELSSGVYLYRLETENFSQSKKLLLLK